MDEWTDEEALLIYLERRGQKKPAGKNPETKTVEFEEAEEED